MVSANWTVLTIAGVKNKEERNPLSRESLGPLHHQVRSPTNAWDVLDWTHWKRLQRQGIKVVNLFSLSLIHDWFFGSNFVFDHMKNVWFSLTNRIDVNENMFSFAVTIHLILVQVHGHYHWRTTTCEDKYRRISDANENKSIGPR